MPDRIRTPADLEALRDVEWIGNSRYGGDDELAHRLCAIAGWTPRIRHRADTLALLADLVAAGTGVCLLPAGSPEAARVRTVRSTWCVRMCGCGAWSGPAPSAGRRPRP